MIVACSCLAQAQTNPRSDSTKNSLHKPGYGTDSVISGGKIYQGGKGQKKATQDSLQRSRQQKAAPNNSGMRQEHGTLKTKPTATGGK